MSELKVVEPDVLVPLGLEDAKRIDMEITSTVDVIGDRLAQLKGYIEEAERGQIHRALGFDSWPDYLRDRMRGRWELKGDDRREMAQLLAGNGVSTRVIAEITGSSKSSIARDLGVVSVPNGTDVETEVDAPVPNGTELPDTVINTRTGKPQRRRKPQPGTAPKPRRRPDVRKGFERMAIQVGGWTNDLKDMNPVELVVDQEVQKGIDYAIEGVAAIRGFLDSVTPARPRPVPTLLRGKVAELSCTITALQELASDPRWVKARTRFSEKDRASVDTQISALQELRDAMVPDPAAAPSEVAKSAPGHLTDSSPGQTDRVAAALAKAQVAAPATSEATK